MIRAHIPPSRRVRRFAPVVALAAGVGAVAVPADASAQSVRGVVVDPGGVPVPGVVVQALDTASAVTGRALTNERGEFLLVAGRPGTYTVRTLRIGYKPVTSAPITLGEGEERSQRFELTGIPVTLSSVMIGGASVCGRNLRDSTQAAFAAWEQVRTALAATQITAGARTLTVTTITYERSLTPNMRVVLRDDITIRTEFARQPWLEVAPALLHRNGYVVEDVMGNVSYHAPGLEMLGSNTFLEDHCLRVDRGSDSTRLGIAFEPVGDRKGTTEVKGTAWLDRATSELRTLDFRYTNLPAERDVGNSGGTMTFVRMSNGAWVIAGWSLRMPVLEQVARESRMGGVQVRLGEMRVVGAELTVARTGADTLWARPGLPMAGTVTDSLTNRPVAGARVKLVGLPRTGTTDDRGRFTVPDVIPGEYTLEVRTASLDSVRAVHQAPIAFIDTTIDVDVKVLNASVIRRALAARQAAAFAGVVTDSAGTPLADVDVTLPELSRNARTARDGSFRINEIPAGIHRVVVRRPGLGSYDAPVSFLAGHVVQRKIELVRVTELAAVTVTAARAAANGLPASFEDHRKAGLGQFFTRDILDQFAGAQLSTILTRTPGLGLVTGRGQAAWLVSTRIPPSLGGNAIYRPEDFEKSQGMKTVCYAQVYLDRVLMNPGIPTEPFNVNSIPPDRIEAIEFYNGAASLPLEYNNLNSACGVMVIHTRKTP